jgi:hypothetical protein
MRIIGHKGSMDKVDVTLSSAERLSGKGGKPSEYTLKLVDPSLFLP